jgi:hypothetical protein
MNQSPAETQKSKRSPSRQWGCLKLLLIPLVLAVACYGGMWLFARYGGELALKERLPIPPNVDKIYQYDWQYEHTNFRSELYDYKGSTQGLTAWYAEQGFEIQEYDNRYSVRRKSTVFNSGELLFTPPEAFIVSLYKTSLNLTSNQSGPEICADGTIFKTHEGILEADFSRTDIPHVNLVGKNIILRRISCWPNVK